MAIELESIANRPSTISPIDVDDNETLTTTTATTFEEQWRLTSATALQPRHMALGRIPRAWERLPRQPMSHKSAYHRIPYKRHHPRSKWLYSTGAVSDSPRVAAKKLRLDSLLGTGLSVSHWEPRGSPSRKIVTRGNATTADRLVALVDDGISASHPEDVSSSSVGTQDEDGNRLENGSNTEGEWVDEGEGQADNKKCTEDRGFGYFQPLPNDIFQLLPDGFVSPKRPSRVRRSSSTDHEAQPRRRSLPAIFAPDRCELPREQLRLDEQSEDAQIESHNSKRQVAQANHELAEAEYSANLTLVEADSDDPSDGTGMDDEWEDVSDDAEYEDGCRSDVTANVSIVTDLNESALPDAASLPSQDALVLRSTSGLTAYETLNIFTSTTDRETPTPRRSPRRLSRRASASPVKETTKKVLSKSNHLVALTPIMDKYARSHERVGAPANSEMELSMELSLVQDGGIGSTSSTSDKHCKSRISDDTALLQAFLNRAAELKATQEYPAPAKSKEEGTTMFEARNVLADLSPNSSSGRALPSPELQEITNEPAARARSVRVRKKPESLATQSVQIATNKITIRANTVGVELRKTETQEIAAITRNNTRRNKGHALLPPLRLKRLMTEVSDDSADFIVMPDNDNKKRGVRWAESLESSQPLSQGSEKGVIGAEDTEMEDSSRTGDVTVKANPTSLPCLVPTSNAEVPNLSIKKRKSRIATPAKGLCNASLLPDDLERGNTIGETKPPVTIKRPISKLPAPSSHTLCQGKENKDLQSPAKRVWKSMPGPRNKALRLEFSSNPIEAVKTPTTSEVMSSPAKKSRQKWLERDAESSLPGLMSPAKRRTKQVAW